MTIDRMNSNRTQYFDYDDVGNRTNLVDITGTTTNYTKYTYNVTTPSVSFAVSFAGSRRNI